MFWNWLTLVCTLLDSCAADRHKFGSSVAVEFAGKITVNNSYAASKQTEANEDIINQSMSPPTKFIRTLGSKFSNAKVDPPIWPFQNRDQAYSFEWVPCSPMPINCGLEYFARVYEHFESAEKEIILMSWTFQWNAPLFYDPEAGDPNPKVPKFTLTDLVVKAANRGIHVYILFWKSTISKYMLKQKVDKDSQDIYAKHKNIHVLVDDMREAVSFAYSAHIKVAVFDRRVGFVGGIDLKNKRIDSPDHLLPDRSRVRVVNSSNLAPQQHGYAKPWQDIAALVTGQPARDLARIAVERWLTYCTYKKGRFKIRISPACDACTEGNKLQPDTHDDFGSLEVTATGSPGSQVLVRLNGMGYDEKVQAFEANKKAIISLGSRRDLGKRATVSVGDQTRARFSKVKTSKFVKQDLPLESIQRRDVEITTGAGVPLVIKWTPRDREGESAIQRERERETANASSEQQCRVMLSGNRRFLGATIPIADLYKEHLILIENAKHSIYIENQYFNTWVYDDSTCSGTSHPENIIGRALFYKIVQMATDNEKFSVAVVFPLSTEEAVTQYPNLRAADCMMQRLTTYWKEHDLPPLENYFGLFQMANIAHSPTKDTHFYGIFVHSKAIVADFELPEHAYSIVGSANINDRSLLEDRDAEVSMGIKGGRFASQLMLKLLGAHVGGAWKAYANALGHATLPEEPGRLVQILREAASKNVEVLKEFGIDWMSGKKDQSALFDQKHKKSKTNAPIFGVGSEAYAIGNGAHWALINKKGSDMTKHVFVGHLLPYSYNTWGDPKQYKSSHHLLTAAWLQTEQAESSGRRRTSLHISSITDHPAVVP